MAHVESAAEAGTLEAVHLSKAYDGPVVVDDVSFTVDDGKFLTLLGPSGSGKSTTLMLIAGFEHPDSGDVRIGGRSIVDAAPPKRNLGIVFQSYALFPHMSVLQNVEFPLRMRKVPRKEQRRRALEMLERVGLEDFADRRPRQLSGGQQQRVALARSLVFQPSVLLLDEPLGALDKHLREMLQVQIKEIHQRLGVSVVYVTHDQAEAMMMSDAIAVIHQGKVAQIGTPSEVYHHPRTSFVATFLGETNLLDCVDHAVSGEFAQVTLSDGTRGTVRDSRNGPADGRRRVSVRPERMILLGSDASATDSENVVDGTLVSHTFLGASHRYTVDALGQEIVVTCPDEDARPRVEPGDRVRVAWSRNSGQLLVDADVRDADAEEAASPHPE